MIASPRNDRRLVLLCLTAVAGVMLGALLFGSSSSGPLSVRDVATIVETAATSPLLLERAVPVVSTPAMQALLPRSDPFLNRRRYKTCAVVGNSGTLLGAGHGAAIDAHDFVVRFNWPALSGFEADVGRRTDVMVVGRSTSLHSLYEPFASYQNFSKSISVVSEIREFDSWLQLQRNMAEPGAPAHQYAFSKYHLELTDALVCARVASTNKCGASSGFRGVVMALRICDHVDAYGFGTASVYGHAPYFIGLADVPLREASLYDYHVELQMLELLALHGAATKSTPSASATPSATATRPLPTMLRALTIGSLKLELGNQMHKDAFPRPWLKYPRLRVYNEDVPLRIDDIDELGHREPPLASLDNDSQLSPLARAHAFVNEGKAREAWDYKHYKIPYSFKKYDRSSRLGHGTYGDVYRAKDLIDGAPAVLKFLKPQEKKPWILSREVLILKTLGGRNSTIKLIDVTFDKTYNSTVLVFPYVKLANFATLPIEDIHVRYYTFKMFEGLAYAHSLGILHNDIKPLNLLVDSDSRELFVADWGLGEFYFPFNSTVNKEPLSFHVGTRHWKAPELLLGSKHYNYAVDVWSAGCTFIGMLFKRVHFFLGEDNQHQIVVIVEMLGTEAFDKYVEKYNIEIDPKWYDHFIGSWSKKSWASQFTADTAHLYDANLERLLNGIMAFDPAERWTAREVMDDPYFDAVRHLSSPPVWPWQNEATTMPLAATTAAAAVLPSARSNKNNALQHN